MTFALLQREACRKLEPATTMYNVVQSKASLCTNNVCSGG